MRASARFGYCKSRQGAPTILASTDLDDRRRRHSRRRRAAAAAAAPLERATSPGDYPRLGGYLVSGSTDYDDPTRAPRRSQSSTSPCSLFPPAWSGSTGPLTMQQAIIAIKAINPLHRARQLRRYHRDRGPESWRRITAPMWTEVAATRFIGGCRTTFGAQPTNSSADRRSPRLLAGEAISDQHDVVHAGAISPGRTIRRGAASFDAVRSTSTAPSLDGIYAVTKRPSRRRSTATGIATATRRRSPIRRISVPGPDRTVL